MSSRDFNKKRALSVTFDENSYLSASKTREIARAIHNRNPSVLLNERISRLSVSPTSLPEDKTGSSFQLQMLKKTINRQRLRVDSGDKNLSNLKSELRQLDIESTKREFFNRQLFFNLKQLEEKLEKTLEKQQAEMFNQQIYIHLLKRMKKTKVFLDSKAFQFNEILKVSDIDLKTAQHKSLVTNESKAKVVNFMKLMSNDVQEETLLGAGHVSHLINEIKKSKVVADRREEWKKHRESMFEAAVIEDRSKKNISIKESINLHRVWYSNLTELFERKKKKFQKLEEAFQRIKIFTGLSGIEAVVENFLTKEFTYNGLLHTVKVKEETCNEIKEKISLLQIKVDKITNDESEKGSLEGVKMKEKKMIRENFELAQKKYLIENINEKIKTCLGEMVRKLLKISESQVVKVKKSDGLLEIIAKIRIVFKEAIEKHKFSKNLGNFIEKSRNLAVKSVISQYSKQRYKVAIEENTAESDLVGF